jgi:hypothetical protein
MNGASSIRSTRFQVSEKNPKSEIQIANFNLRIGILPRNPAPTAGCAALSGFGFGIWSFYGSTRSKFR